MPDEDRAQIEALIEANARLLRRLEQLEDRIQRLEHPQVPRSVFPSSPPPLPVAPPPTIHTEPPPIPVVAPIELTPATSPIQNTMPQPQALETRMGLTWINRIGVLTLVIGVAFFFKYAIDNQWIGETGRVAIGILAGLATLAAADVLWRRDQKIFAQGVCGLGVSILYLSFYATFGLYHLLPQPVAFVLMVVTTAMAAALSLRYDAMAIAALAMLGGYATPLLLSTGQDAPWIFFGYLLLIDAGGLALARARRWRPLDALAFAATAILYASWFFTWFHSEKFPVAVAALFAFYLLFSTADWAWIGFASQALAAAALCGIAHDLKTFLILNLVLDAAGLAIADMRRRPLAATAAFTSFWAAYGFWSLDQGIPTLIGTTIAVLTAAFLLHIAWVVFEKMFRDASVRMPHLAILGLNGAIYFGASYAVLDREYHSWLGLFALAVAAVHMLLGIWFWNTRDRENYDARPVLLLLAIALGFLTLAIPIQFSGFSITLSWSIEAAALAWIARRTGERRALFAAWAIYLCVFVRLFSYDALLSASHSLIANSRFLAFAVASISLWLAALWSQSEAAAATVEYISGHCVFFSALLFELNDWVLQSVAAENQRSVLAVSVSILMALYAFLLVGIGVAKRSALNRILGLGLIALVIAKLYLYDVWEASRLFRTAAFLSLGVLLLLVSFLYSRFRPAIESWWHDEKPSA